MKKWEHARSDIDWLQLVRVKGGEKEFTFDAGGWWQVAVRWDWSAGDHPRLMKGMDNLVVWHNFNSWQTVEFGS